MKKDLLIEVSSQPKEFVICDKSKKIDFSRNFEELSSSYSDIKLYLVDEEYYENEDNENKQLIATLYGRYFDIDYAMDNDIDLYDVFDAEDGDSASLIKYLVKDSETLKDEYQCFYQNIYYLDRIEVDEEFRGQGYAKYILENLPGILTYAAKLKFGLIMIQAQPFDRINGEEVMVRDDDERKERLIKLYENAGYTRIDDSNYLFYINE